MTMSASRKPISSALLPDEDPEKVAAEWVLRHDTGLDEAARREFETWRAADPRHEEAFARLSGLWTDFERGGENSAAQAILERVELRARKRRRRRAALSAVALLALLATAVPGLMRRDEPVERTASAALPFEPVRKLPDGSIVELNTGAEIAVRFEESTRRVVLVRGEAHFRVEKDARRPFVVEANGVAVRAVGTAFTVQLERDEVEVVVTDGRIAIDRTAPTAPPGPTAAEPAPLATVAAGNRVLVATAASPTSPPRIEAMSDAQIERRLAWRIPRLEFDGMELAQAVKLMNRENRLQIVLGEEAIGRLRISGLFRTDSPAAFVTIVTRSFGLSATQRNEFEIVLTTP